LLQEADIPEDYRCRNYFDDVSTAVSKWICRAVELAADEGLITKLNDIFRPQEDITRAEAFSILHEAAGKKVTEDEQIYTLYDHDAVKWQSFLFNKLVHAGYEIPGVNF